MLSYIKEGIRRVQRSASTRLFAGLLVAAMAAPYAYGQVLYGTLTGSVIDQSGGAVAGAKVDAVSSGTGVTKSTTTDERGNYQFTDLLPGSYNVTIEAANFSTLLQKDVRVESGQVRRVNGQLKLSQITEVVEVTFAEPVLQTDRADVNIVQSTRQVNDLPLTGSSGRNYQSLMQIVPGALMAGEQNSAAGSPQRSLSFNVNGTSRLQNNTRLDGASVVYPWLPTNTAYVPSAEAIETVNIVTNSFNAEQGLAGGAAINVVIKSGSKDFHGTAWGYRTDAEWRARNYFQAQPQPGQPKNPVNVLDQFGANLGGPVIKGKLFFFANWERTKRTNAAALATLEVPTAALRAGDFSGTGTTIYDPASNPNPALRTPFPGNIIPANRIDPAALEMIKRMPLPTGPGYVDNYRATGEGVYKRDNVDFKLNYDASSRLQLFGRYSISPSNILDPPALGEAGGDAVNGGQLGTAPGRTQVAGIGGTYTITPTLLLDANIGYTRQRLGAETTDLDTNFGLDVLKIPGTNGPDRLQGGQPAFQIANWSNLGNPNTGNPFLFRDNQYVASMNLQWLKGSHSFRFGYDYQNQQINHFQPQGGQFHTARGTFGFNGNSTALQNGTAPNNFNSWASFLLGLPSRAGKVDQLRNPNSVRMQAHALYARDQWQISRKLTLNYGVRWERYPWPTRDQGGVSRFDPEDGNVYIGGNGNVPLDTGADIGIGQFLPRLGLAYRLDDRTVVRAGYGHSADPKPYIDFRNAYPINFIWEHPTVTFNGATNTYIPVTTLRAGLDQAKYGTAPDLTQGVLKLPATAGTTTYPKDGRRGYIQSWNAMFQRGLSSQLTLQVGYVGTLVRDQQGFINQNAGLPGTGNAGRPLFKFGLTSDINMIAPFKDATYHSLQSEFRGRFSSAQFGVVYTLGKAVNYQDNDGNPRIPLLEFAENNKGPAGFDRRHNLQTYWVWDLPFGRNRKFANEGIANALLGGWQINGVMSLMSGTPVNIIQNNPLGLNAGGSGQYPDLVKDDVEILEGVGLGNPYFDRSAFAIVNITSGPQRFGTSPRNPIYGPGLFNIDLGVFRSIYVSRVTVQLRAEALNVLNHPNFANPGGDISNAGTFGFITGTTGTGERNLRFGARVSF